MDQIKNPFSPGAGAPPPELVGRSKILERCPVLFGRVKTGRAEKSMFLVGLRGVGKTVLLNHIERIAVKSGWRTLFFEAQESKPLYSLLIPPLKKFLFELDRLAGFHESVKRALGVLKSFANGLKMKYGEVEVGLDINPEIGAADSGDIEIDLPNLLVAVGEAAKGKSSAIGLLIDEVQYLAMAELSALVLAMHKIQQNALPVVLVGAGLPVLPGLLGASKSYAERLFEFPEVGQLSREDAARAIEKPIRDAGESIDLGALDEIFEMTKGYPYFLQEWGYHSWNVAERSPITRHIVQSATTNVIQGLDSNFFRVRFDRLTPGEKNFLRVMADLGGGPYRSGDIAGRLGVKLTSLGPVRAKLIKKGMIYSPTHGDLAFTVPLFDQFMCRTIPKEKLSK